MASTSSGLRSRLRLFLEEYRRAFAPNTPTGVILLDLAGLMQLDFPATLPLILARYVRIRAGERMEMRLAASGEIYVVLKGTGVTEWNDGQIAWSAGDVFVLPGGEQRRPPDVVELPSYFCLETLAPQCRNQVKRFAHLATPFTVDKQRKRRKPFVPEILTSRDACRASLGVLCALRQRIPKITVTGALHDRLRTGQLHVGTKAFCHGKIRAACQQES